MEVLVHGGAGGDPDEPEERQAVLDEAARAGTTQSDPVDAVESAIAVLETSPRFNAGIGGTVQSDGVPRTDAGLMTGDGRVGAVCAMEGVEHAVSAARVVLEETPHVLVAGEHAETLAADFGVETGLDTWSERSRERWDEEGPPPSGGPAAHLEWIRDRFGGTDTVGAVAAGEERVAAATSTGGRWFALAGRVGDVPQVGGGFYASEAGAASATGAGEDIARTTLTRRAIASLESGMDPQEAAEEAIEFLGAETGSTAGIIVVDARGNRGSAYNSDSMQTASAGAR